MYRNTVIWNILFSVIEKGYRQLHLELFLHHLLGRDFLTGFVRFYTHLFQYNREKYIS